MRLIDADELKKKLKAEHCDCEVIQIIDDMPTTEAKPINHGWISVTDRLPNTGQKVIVWETNKNKIDVNEFAGRYEGWYYRNDNITHWQPFPEPPEGSNSNEK